MSKTRVNFCASGSGSETRTFKSKNVAQKHIERDAEEVAAGNGGEVVDYGNGEWG